MFIGQVFRNSIQVSNYSLLITYPPTPFLKYLMVPMIGQSFTPSFSNSILFSIPYKSGSYRPQIGSFRSKDHIPNRQPNHWPGSFIMVTRCGVWIKGKCVINAFPKYIYKNTKFVRKYVLYTHIGSQYHCLGWFCVLTRYL